MNMLTLPSPKIASSMLELVTIISDAVIVQTDDGAVFALDRLTAAQADDPAVTVLVRHDEALDYVARAGGRVSGGARLATATLRAQHDRGLL